MKKPININETNEVIRLERGKYKIDILGGWNVKVGEFSITIQNIENSEVIKCEHSFFGVQSFAFKKRAKRIFKINVPQTGYYRILFQNPESIKVKFSNLFFTSLFQNTLLNDDLEIFFIKN